MTASSTFLSKCTTIFVGVGLSWATVTNPAVDSLASGLFGTRPGPVSIATADEDIEIPDIRVGGESQIDSPLVTDMPSTTSSLADVPSGAGMSAFQDGDPHGDPHGVPHENAASASDAAGLVPIEVGQTQNIQANEIQLQGVQLQGSLPSEERIHIQQISDELKQIGATYLLLDRLPQSDTPQYRVRCDLAGENGRIKCCFEAIRPSALAAMEEVLYAARQHVILNGGEHQAVAGKSGRPAWISGFRN